MSTEMHVLTNWYNGHRLVRYVNVPLPSYTLRVRYNTGVTPIIDNATVTPVQGMTDVYDITTVDGDWSYLFYSDSDLLEVIEANSTGVTNMAYMFSECYNLINVYLFDTSSVTNMQGTFGMCTNVQSGALALYTQASTQTTPPANHTDTFYKCGENTVTGAAELDQIPSDWGGNDNTVVISGRTYRTVTINGVTWLVENLDYGSDGIYYNNDESTYGWNGLKYGKLYTWAEAVAAANAIPGWHLPSDDEWAALANAVGGTSVAGTKLKSTTGWSEGNGTDDFGFAAFPAGYKYSYTGSFYNLGSRTYFWTATEFSSTAARSRYFDTDASMHSYNYNKTDFVFSVRLVKDS